MNAPADIRDQLPDHEFLKRLSVLYVEDDEEVRGLLARFLERRVGHLDVAGNGEEGLAAFARRAPDVVITDIKMPVMDGLEMATNMKRLGQEIPIIVITAYSDRDYLLRAIEIGVDRYVTKPVDTDVLLHAIIRSAHARFQQIELERARQGMMEALHQTVAVLSRAIELRDPYTDGHQKRVSQLAEAIGERLGLTPDQLVGIRLGSLVHDVGKIHVPADILNSPRDLRGSVEFDLIKIHPRAGHDILAGTPFPWPVGRMVLEHHERLDGSGYPDGLAGDAISLEARIIAVADVVEAMTSHRPYRPAFPLEAALDEIRAQRGRLYDPAAVDACVAVMEESGGNFWN